MRCRIAVGILALLLAGPVPTQAGDFTYSRHIASGWGTANVFDGGPPDTDSDAITLGLEMSFAADDATRSGSRGAVTQAFGFSRITPGSDQIRFQVTFRATYDPSLFEDGDRPGGTSEGKLSSLIEFRMPQDWVAAGYFFNIDQTSGYTGSSSLLVENVTQSEILLALTSVTFPTHTVFVGHEDDLIRISTEIQGAGSAPANSYASRQYGTRMELVVGIPEPSTLGLLGLGTWLFGFPRALGPR